MANLGGYEKHENIYSKVNQLKQKAKSWDAPERRYEAPQGKNAYGSGLCFFIGLLLGGGGQGGGSNRLTTLFVINV